MTRLSNREKIITLFNTLWYRDFPLTPARSDEKRVRAMYTAHLNGIVKSCADLLGFFVLYEHGHRTDAIIQTASSRTIAMFEFEWKQARRDDVNEIAQLSAAAKERKSENYVFVGYSDLRFYEENLNSIKRQWTADEELIVILIIYSLKRDRRNFENMETHLVASGSSKKIYTQRALPWKVEDTRWHIATAEFNEVE